MIGDDDAIGTRVHRLHGVIGMKESLDDEFASPAGANAFQIVPVEMILFTKIAQYIGGNDGGTTGLVGVFKMRHSVEHDRS